MKIPYQRAKVIVKARERHGYRREIADRLPRVAAFYFILRS
jgi:hypothetical protein